MDKYIILSFSDQYLSFYQTNNTPSPDEFINSNKIFQNKFIYTFRYFKRNEKDIIVLTNKESYKRKIISVYLEDNKLVDLILSFIKISNFKSLYIKNFKALTTEQCNVIMLNKSLNYINCYYMPNVYLQKLKKLKKKVNTNYLDSISDEFLKSQNVKDEDSLYYKDVLNINKNTEFKSKDIQEFFNLNTCLKTVHVHSCDKKSLDTILSYLVKDNRKNVTILLYQDERGFIENNFKYLKEISKKYGKELDGDMKIIYSSNYIKNNIFKQLNYNSMKMIVMIILYIMFIGLLFTTIYNYVSQLNVDKLNYQMYLDSLSVSSNEEESSSSGGKYSFVRSFLTLTKTNPDTVGWLTVNNTNINYPVVQADDNEYYLKRDFYKSKTSAGWVFMDYRNNGIVLDDNTIIFGHKLKNGLMFGSLSNVLKSSWYKDAENQIITFDSLSTQMKWQIFSIYKTSYTTEYLKTTFNTVESFDEFMGELKTKSIYDFNQKLEYGDKILTLSTCTGYSSSNQRLVVHAKLIKE